ncbi:O-methyltransferase [Polymorphobacter glacialis]|uniref:O-methyltransferase n=1 Tax=Sandarakinorhabdus glacialis TaxID=1614636 RepID=A0A916ZPV8_9SPHN|nr:O-methyltransferase [Polymorphobacter glacialis]GGE06287.1 O-methyltransferase [Polymorphobacter glacialis]
MTPDNLQAAAVDAYIASKLLPVDRALEAALAANAAAGLPPIDVSAAQGRMLELLARMIGARRILEVGTLGGYSTICLLRALPKDGCLISLELEPLHAAVAVRNLDNAGAGGRAQVRVGAAIETLEAMIAAGEGDFDMVFIDADKPGNVAYLRASMALCRPGAMIIVDNVVREGAILDADSDDPRVIGTRALFDEIALQPRLAATAIQTVGAKHWDGFMLIHVGAA